MFILLFINILKSSPQIKVIFSVNFILMKIKKLRLRGFDFYE